MSRETYDAKSERHFAIATECHWPMPSTYEQDTFAARPKDRAFYFWRVLKPSSSLALDCRQHVIRVANSRALIVLPISRRFASMANPSGFLTWTAYILFVFTWLFLVNKNVHDPYLVRRAEMVLLLSY